MIRLRDLQWTREGIAIVQAPPVDIFIYNPSRCLLIGTERPKHMPEVGDVRFVALHCQSKDIVLDRLVPANDKTLAETGIAGIIQEAVARCRSKK